MDNKVLIILHQETSTPGRVGMLLEKRGYKLITKRPSLGDKLPDSLEDGYAGAVMFGGPMSANDQDDFIKYEKEWIQVPLKENKPFLGICLGAQLLSCSIGGTITTKDNVEIGYYPIRPTEYGRKLLNWPPFVHQWHREWMRPPQEAKILAVGLDEDPQAFQYGEKAFGIQFHSELTQAMINRWLVKAEHRLLMNGAQQRDKHFEGRLLYDKHVKTWLNDFFDLLLKKI
jgi:GMP synthase (glutamine-hydrolysing)